MKNHNDKRKYERYDTEIQIYFAVTYDIQTKVEFQVLDESKESLKKYSAVSKNVSAEGLCFYSEKELKRGDRLYLEVYIPGSKKPIGMEGEVRWSQGMMTAKKKKVFDTGVKLLVVNGESVAKSIYRDDKYQVIWSTVLECVLGNFRILQQKKRKKLL